jgi:hypothetical protein
VNEVLHASYPSKFVIAAKTSSGVALILVEAVEVKTAFDLGIVGVAMRRLSSTEFWIAAMRNSIVIKTTATPTYTKVFAMRMFKLELPVVVRRYV